MRSVPVLVGVLLVGMSQQASAHGFAGGGGGHLLTGPDHMVAMVAVGLWSAQQGGRALWLAPLGFVIAMGIGAWGGYAGWPMPMSEPTIPGAVIALGVAIGIGRPSIWPVAAGGILLFGLAHGAVHGAETLLEADPFGYATGLLITTAGAPIVGAAVGLLVLERQDGKGLLRLAGGTVGVVGALFLSVAQ